MLRRDHVHPPPNSTNQGRLDENNIFLESEKTILSHISPSARAGPIPEREGGWILPASWSGVGTETGREHLAASHPGGH